MANMKVKLYQNQLFSACCENWSIVETVPATRQKQHLTVDSEMNSVDESSVQSLLKTPPIITRNQSFYNISNSSKDKDNEEYGNEEYVNDEYVNEEYVNEEYENEEYENEDQEDKDRKSKNQKDVDNAEMVEEEVEMKLIEYQLTHSESKRNMADLLTLINEIAELRQITKPLVPKSFYKLTKKYSYIEEKIEMRFICSNIKCSTLTLPYRKEKNKNYDSFRCHVCNQNIYPSAEINKRNGFFVVADIAERLKKMLENLYIFKQISFCNKKNFSKNNYGHFSSGAVYKMFMNEGDISLTLFADGVRPHVSSSHDFWPCLLKLNELHKDLQKKFIIPAVIYYGSEKPSGKHIIDCISKELNSLGNDGIDFENPMNSSHDNIKIKTIFGVFDSIAKPMFLNILSPKGHASCPSCHAKCRIKQHCTIFPASTSDSRRKEDYSAFIKIMIENKYQDYNGIRGRAPLLDLQNYHVYHSTTIDKLHAVDLGVTKRLLNYIYNNKRRFFKGNHSIRRLDLLISEIRAPSELCRPISSLKNLNNWKAHEFSNFLIYAMPIVMKNFMIEDKYKHFFVYSFCIGIMTKKIITPGEVSLCEDLLNYFVSGIEHHFDEFEMTFSMHLLLHLPDTIKNIGCLRDVDAYFFEDINGTLRNYVSGNKNIQKQMMIKNELDFIRNLRQLDQVKTKTTKLRCIQDLDPKFLSLCSTLGTGITKQFATYTCSQGTYYTSQSYSSEKKTCNYLIRIDTDFFFAQCYVQFNDKIYAIGRRAHTICHLAENIVIKKQKHNLQMKWIHKIQSNDFYELCCVDSFGKKVMYVNLSGIEYAVELFYMSAF